MTPDRRPAPIIAWLDVHLPVVLYGWFWFGMFLCGLMAPPDRVADLQSGVIQQGWHLSVMACVLGLPVIVAYALRVRRPRRPPASPTRTAASGGMERTPDRLDGEL